MRQWPDFVYDAYNDNTKDLSDYLRSADCSPNLIQRRQLVDLIYRKIHNHGRGRKLGIAPTLTKLRAEFKKSTTLQTEPLHKRTSRTKTRKKSTFQYRPRTQEMAQRRYRMGGWPLAITKAHSRDTKDLCDYLLSPDLPLDSEWLENLAELFDRDVHVREGKKGKKPGRFTPLEERQGVITTEVAASVIKNRRRKFGKVSGVSVEEEIERFANFCSDAGYEVDIDKDKAVRSIRRGKRRKRGTNSVQ